MKLFLVLFSPPSIKHEEERKKEGRASVFVVLPQFKNKSNTSSRH